MFKRANEKLTARQEKAIAALLNEPTVSKAADACGVPLRTLNRWISEPVFGDEYRRLRREAFRHSVSMAQKYAPAALNALASIMMDKAAGQSARVAASKAVLDYGRQSLELDDMARRIEKLEADAAAREKAGPSAYGYGGGR